MLQTSFYNTKKEFRNLIKIYACLNHLQRKNHNTIKLCDLF